MNDFLEPLESRKRQRSTLADTRRSLTGVRDTLKRALADHRSFDPKGCEAELSRLEIHRDQISESLAVAEAILQAQSAQLNKLMPGRVSPLKIITYFSAEQKDLRSKIGTIEAQINESKKNKITLETKLAKCCGSIAKNTRDLKEHQNFAPQDFEGKLQHTSKKIDAITVDIDRLDAEISNIDRRIGPLLGEYKEMKAKVKTLKAIISQADSLDEDLSNAENGYERSQIHADCEARLGHGSPKKVRAESSRELRSIENNLPKLERRIKDELKKIDMVVSHIIIDGNNVCYDRSNFIRMHALTHLVDELAGLYKVTVLFDASIRSLMRSDDAGIERIIDGSASVHVAPTRNGADEYILRLAQTDPNAYVLSNDRFAEFGEYEAVKSGRLLRFLIANNQIMLNALDISVPFRTSA